MRITKQIIFMAIILVLAGLACGTATGIQVIPPDEAEDEIGETPTEPEDTPEVGMVRSYPAPAGSKVVVENQAYVVSSAIFSATDIVLSANESNPMPDTGMKYILVKLEITCLKSPDEQCSFETHKIKLIGSKGIEYLIQENVVDLDHQLKDTDFYGEAVLSGYLPFIVGVSETDFILVHEPFFGEVFYLEVPDEDDPLP